MLFGNIVGSRSPMARQRAPACPSCTAPIFFLVVATAFLETGAGIGLLVFLAYAAGIVLLMLVATVLVTAVGEGALVRFKRALPYVRPASALVMLAVGGYLLAYYFTR